MEMVDKIRSEACGNSSEAAVIEFQHSEKIGGNSSSSSSSSSNGAASETVIDVKSEEEVQEHEKRSNVEDGGLMSNQVVAVEAKLLGDQEACVVNVDVSKGCDKLEEEKVCRICHLEPDQRLDLNELFQLGCDCKGELGVAHRHCAEAWFKLKGDR